VVKAFCVFVCLQMLGELISAAFRLPVPGALIGMLILFMWLTLRAELPEALASGADTLHQHLGLFFVPVGVSFADPDEKRCPSSHHPRLHLALDCSGWLVRRENVLRAHQ
jgi:Na+/citrate or Na+/malate symporter